MSAAVVEALLAELEERGIRVRAEGWTLHVSPPDRVDPELLDRLKAAKPYLLAALTGPRPLPDDCHPCERCGRFAFSQPTTCWWCLTTREAEA